MLLGRGSGGGSGEEEGSSGRGGSRRLRDDLRRHTLSSSEHRYAQLRSVDLESPQPRGYPPPNMLLDDDPGIMSEVETSSTGFRRGNRQRSSLPVVRTTSKTLERPLGVKTAAKNYQDGILEPVVKALNDTLFAGSHCVFLQDSAPAHKARSAQQWMQKNILEFIYGLDRTSENPDLSPLDYRLCSELERMACHRAYPNLENLKQSLFLAVERFP
ncbi:unnamed protein product [Nezara viridula]|uniref:Tc1-like transposase DDE domain-containing protein n=1 Tax=Nezara viridula TaxID=85310 RepID=A0A9P0MCS9_NEZVI|nr:unnamed protein product [Nezara viridula]